MSKDARFWRNVTLIGLAHVVLIVGLVRWSRGTKNAQAQSVVWLVFVAERLQSHDRTESTIKATLDVFEALV